MMTMRKYFSKRLLFVVVSQLEVLGWLLEPVRADGPLRPIKLTPDDTYR